MGKDGRYATRISHRQWNGSEVRKLSCIFSRYNNPSCLKQLYHDFRNFCDSSKSSTLSAVTAPATQRKKSEQQKKKRLKISYRRCDSKSRSKICGSWERCSFTKAIGDQYYASRLCQSYIHHKTEDHMAVEWWLGLDRMHMSSRREMLESRQVDQRWKQM